MTDTTRINPKAAAAPRATDNTHTGRGETHTTPERDFVHEPDAAGSPGTKWSTKNIVIGLGVALLVIVVLMMLF